MDGSFMEFLFFASDVADLKGWFWLGKEGSRGTNVAWPRRAFLARLAELRYDCPALHGSTAINTYFGDSVQIMRRPW
jgi:hypothetical protein